MGGHKREVTGAGMLVAFFRDDLVGLAVEREKLKGDIDLSLVFVLELRNWAIEE